MTFTIGADCHLTLQHEAVNGGQVCGFLLNSKAGAQAETIRIKREMLSEGSPDELIEVSFEILLGDGLQNPDGSKHEVGFADMYAKLQAFLQQKDGIVLTCPQGVLANLGALGISAREEHFSTFSRVSVMLSNAVSWFGFIDPQRYQNSVWDGALTWATSCWR